MRPESARRASGGWPHRVCGRSQKELGVESDFCKSLEPGRGISLDARDRGLMGPGAHSRSTASLRVPGLH